MSALCGSYFQSSIVPHHLPVCRKLHTDSPAQLDSIWTLRINVKFNRHFLWLDIPMAYERITTTLVGTHNTSFLPRIKVVLEKNTWNWMWANHCVPRAQVCKVSLRLYLFAYCLNIYHTMHFTMFTQFRQCRNAAFKLSWRNWVKCIVLYAWVTSFRALAGFRAPPI